jgi:hypothetical protein
VGHWQFRGGMIPAALRGFRSMELTRVQGRNSVPYWLGRTGVAIQPGRCQPLLPMRAPARAILQCCSWDGRCQSSMGGASSTRMLPSEKWTRLVGVCPRWLGGVQWCTLVCVEHTTIHASGMHTCCVLLHNQSPEPTNIPREC